MRVGLIADTHGLLRPEALAALRGADVILHAGDVGHPDVLAGLAEVAPVHAVRGNVDEPEAVRRSRRRNAPAPEWAADLPERLTLELAGWSVTMLHVRQVLGPPPPDVRVVVSGHSHQPLIETVAGVLWVNPGSAGPRRFSLPITCAWLHLEAGRADAEIISLTV